MRELLFWFLLLVGMAPVLTAETWQVDAMAVSEDGSVTTSDGNDGPPPHK